MIVSPEILFTAACLAVGALCFAFKIIKRRRKRCHLPDLPPAGPSLKEFGKEAKRCRLARNQILWAKKYGTVYSVRSPFTALLPNIVLVGDVKVAKQLLTEERNNSKRFISRDADTIWMTRQGEGASITAMTGEPWKWRKNALLKEFHRSRMGETERGLFQKIVQTGQQLCQHLDDAAKDGAVVKVDLLTTRVAIDVVIYFMFGKEIEFDAEVIGSSAYTMLEMVAHCVANPLHFLLRYLPFGQCWRMERSRDAAWKAIDDLFNDEIHELLEEPDGSKPESHRKPGAAVPSLLKNEPRFRTEGLESLVADIRLFLLAGFETTAHGLSFSFGLLASHPEIADQIAKEGKVVWSKLTCGSTAEIKQALDQAPTAKYLFLETVRLYPLVPILGGTCLQDLTVTTSEGEDFGLPQKTRIIFANEVLNRQRGGDAVVPSLWDAPPEDQPFINTFNVGVHACPGKALSLLEAHVFLLMAATKFEFLFPPQESSPMDYLDHFVLKPRYGMPLIVRKRL